MKTGFDKGRANLPHLYILHDMNHFQLHRYFRCGPASIFALLLGLLQPSAAHAQTALPPAIRDELAVMRDAKDVSPEAIERLCEIGDATPQQNLQQLCYKTACAGLAYLDATNQYEKVLAKVITKTFADVFQEQCPRCRGIGKTKVTCPDCKGRRCSSCAETGIVKSRCPDCNGTASVFSHKRALSAYRRGLAALAKSPEPISEQTPPPAATPQLTPRLTDDQFFARHSLDLAAYAVFTNSASTSIQKNEAFTTIARRAYKPRGFTSPILLYRYPTGESFEVTDVARDGEKYRVTLQKTPDDFQQRTLIIPAEEKEVALWKKGRKIESRDWVYAGKVYPGMPPHLPPDIHTSDNVFYRSLAEFQRLHPEERE